MLISIPATLDELFQYESSTAAFLPEDFGSVEIQRNYVRRLLDSGENPFACQFVEHLLKNVKLSRGFNWEGHEGWSKPLRILSSHCEVGVMFEEEPIDLLLTLKVWDGEVHTRRLALFVCTDAITHTDTDFLKLERLAKVDFSCFHGGLMLVLGYVHLLDKRCFEVPVVRPIELHNIFRQCYLCCNQLTLFEGHPISPTFRPQFIAKWINALGAEAARFDLASQSSKLISDSHDYLAIRKFGYRSWEHFVCYSLADLRYRECAIDIPGENSSIKIFFDFVSSWKGTGPSLRLYISPLVRRIIPEPPDVDWSLALEVNRLKFRIETTLVKDGWLATWSQREEPFLDFCSKFSGHDQPISTIIDDDKKWILYSWPVDTSNCERVLNDLGRLLSNLYRAGIISHRNFEWHSSAD